MTNDAFPARVPPLARLSGSTWLRPGNTSAPRYPRPAETPVSIGDPALRVVTDFSWEPPVTTEIGRSIDEALRRMISAGVRSLLVTRDDAIVGLITAYDIQGERPLQLLEASNYSRHDELEVGHLMTPWNELLTLDWTVVESARVYYLEELMSRTNATHIPLVQRADQRERLVRGVLSRTRLERQLGHAVSTAPGARIVTLAQRPFGLPDSGALAELQ